MPHAFQDLMKQAIQDTQSRVILALDKIYEVPQAISLDAATQSVLKIAEQVAPHVAAIKVNYPLILMAGLGIITELKRVCQRPIIADFKIADIDNTNKLIATQAFSAGADAVIAHLFTGQDSVKAVCNVASSFGKGVIGLPNMSHPGAAQFIRPNAERLAALAKELDLSGVIAPATRPFEVTQMRDWIGEEILILCPGVGKQGGGPGDAIRAGADFEIVGRSIYTSETPTKPAIELQAATWKAHPIAEVVDPQLRSRYVKKELVRRVALGLLDAEAIKFGDFTLASGKWSPYYIDLRLVPSYPQLFQEVTDLFTRIIKNNIKDIDAVAGIPTAGVSFATRIAHQLEKPLLYIRTSTKSHGRKRLVEGKIVPGQRVLLIDDLITDGGSKIPVIEAAREAGLEVSDIVVLLDRLQGGEKILQQQKTTLHVTATILDLLEVYTDNNRISSEQNRTIRAYLQQ